MQAADYTALLSVLLFTAIPYGIKHDSGYLCLCSMLRKIKSSFLDEPSQQQEAPAPRKTPISLPKAEEPEEIYDDTAAVSAPHGAPEDIYDDTAGVAPHATPDLPKTRNLLAEGLPKRQNSDDEQEEEQDWDGTEIFGVGFDHSFVSVF